MTAPPTDRPTLRTDVEGLRGIAILLVVLFHAGLSTVRGGFVAVDVFFVISGFFVTGALVREIAKTESVNLTAFYAKRLLRLLPAMIVVVLATLGTAMLLYAPIDRAAVASTVRSVAFFASNLAFAAEGVNYFSATERPLLHTWSLGVEQQFNLLWPVLLLLFAWFATRRAARLADTRESRLTVVRAMLYGIVLAGAISFVLALMINERAPMWAYFGPHTRLWEFALGGATAMVIGTHNSIVGAKPRSIMIAQLLGLAAIAIPALLYDRSMPYPGTLALVPVLGTLLFLSAGDLGSTTTVGKLLSVAPLQSLGRLSYAWYLWHLPLMVLGAMLYPAIGVPGRLAFGAVGLGAAWLTYRFVETPVRRGPIASRPADTVLFGAMIACTLLMLLGHIAAVSSERRVANSVHRVFAAAREDRMDHQCWARSVDRLPGTSCAFGDRNSSTTIALLGDSHAEHWLGGLDRAGREHGWKIEANVMGGCPVADFSGLTSGASTRRYRECTRYREAMLTRIIAQRPRAVILSSYDHYVASPNREDNDYTVSDAAWQQGLRRTYSRLASAGITTIVIRGTPRTWFDVPSCLSRRAAKMPFASSCSYDLDRAFIANAQAAQNNAARGLPINFIDMNDQICTSSPCTTVKNGIVVFTDDNHLTASFTRSLSGVLGSRIAAVVH